ncbi:MAG: hypothetical protein IJ493_04840 [Clostridia bacterium]|nr:hypothetical protein [Clostridia bacterium]
MNQTTHFTHERLEITMKNETIKRPLLLCEFLMRDLLIAGLAVSAALIVVQQLMFALQLDSAGSLELRYVLFSTMIDQSGFAGVYVAAVVLLMALLTASVLRRYLISRSVLSLYTVPVSRVWVFIAYLVGGVMTLLLLSAAQHISVRLAYEQLYAALTSLRERVTYTVYVEPNAVWLAFLRDEFLHFVLPRTAGEWLFMLTVHLGAPAVTLCAALSVMARRWSGLALAAGFILLCALGTADVIPVLIFAALVLAAIAGWKACSLIRRGDTL